MPDVKMFIKDDIKLPPNFDQFVRMYSAARMTCEECEVTHDQIDLLIVKCAPDDGYPTDSHSQGSRYRWSNPMLFSSSDVIIEVSGYTYPSRTANITERLEVIAAAVRRELGGLHRVSATFLEVKEGCWTAV